MPGEGGRCEGRPCRAASPVLAQLQDQRKSLEAATETSVVSRMGRANASGATDSRQDKVAAFAPGREAGWGVGYHLEANCHQVGLLVTRETSGGARPSQPL